jgi:glycosyltransferase involved in cell wall biosynthesis
LEAIESYKQFADEIVVVDGSCSLSDTILYKVIHRKWPWEFDWTEIPQAMNTGLDAIKSDWAVRMDCDYIMPADSAAILRVYLDNCDSDVVTMQKMNVVLHNRAFEKTSVPLCINKKKVGDTIKLGFDNLKETDACYPVRVISDRGGVPYGISDYSVKNSSAVIMNYDYSFKSLKQTHEEFWRFSQAYHRTFGKWTFGENEDAAFDVFVSMMKGRLARCTRDVVLTEPKGDKQVMHPQMMHDRIKKLTENEFSYNGWGLL